MQDIASQISVFKQDLPSLNARQIVQKHITFGETAVLSQAQHFNLRAKIAEHFDIHPHAVVVVGSAKLGFSIKPSRRYGPFGNDSDVDLALVSTELFQRLWRELQRYVDNGGYWERLARFQSKFFDGWIRPDLMPSSRSLSITADWWEFFLELTRSGNYGPYKISAGLYYDWHCLERYQVKAVASCRDEATNA